MNGTVTVGGAAAVALPARIGDDHALALEELGAVAAGASELWQLYEGHFERFCGARLDPQWCRLDHPARHTGAVRVHPGTPMVVVGTGPSLALALPDLRRVRPGLCLVTSPRGADALAVEGLVPDLVIIEHQTALDAQFTLSDRGHRPSAAVSAASFVAADARTPAGLLQGVSSDRLYVPDPWPSWGLWPATAVGMAIEAGASAIGLIGIDLGSRARPDPRQAALRDLLAWLGRHAGVTCVDLGCGGAEKAYWPSGSVDALASSTAVPALSLDARPWLTVSRRVAQARDAWHRLVPLADAASHTLAAACRVRDGAASTDLEEGLARLLDAGRSVGTRVDAQDGLGLAFLPRYWRRAPDRSLGDARWRAAALASHELVRQHGALGRRLENAA